MITSYINVYQSSVDLKSELEKLRHNTGYSVSELVTYFIQRGLKKTDYNKSIEQKLKVLSNGKLVRRNIKK